MLKHHKTKRHAICHYMDNVIPEIKKKLQTLYLMCRKEPFMQPTLLKMQCQVGSAKKSEVTCKS